MLRRFQRDGVLLHAQQPSRQISRKFGATTSGSAAACRRFLRRALWLACCRCGAVESGAWVRSLRGWRLAILLLGLAATGEASPPWRASLASRQAGASSRTPRLHRGGARVRGVLLHAQQPSRQTSRKSGAATSGSAAACRRFLRRALWLHCCVSELFVVWLDRKKGGSRRAAFS